ncbi:DNA-binding protein inhibitor ID-1 [Sphaeramia orbicularis]|nr:DNA-binding protein inhibitor ID-1 [Sphaeramia orbicularis]
MWTAKTVNITLRTFPTEGTLIYLETRPPKVIDMKVVGSTCALKTKVGGEDVVRCLSDQSLSISKCKIPLLDEQMSVFLQDMNSCYSKLKELVPTLPTNKKASKVEILQHVIDYIWDLQVELDEPDKSRAHSASGVPRTPLTTLNAELASITVENGCSDDRIMCR